MNRTYFKGLGVVAPRNIKPFVINIKTDVESDLCLSDSNQFRAPFNQFITNGPKYNVDALNVRIIWGDGTEDIITSWDDPKLLHTYPTAGDYQVKILSPDFLGFCFDFSQNHNMELHDALKLTSIEEWGDFKFTNQASFRRCWRMVSNATDKPKILTNDMSETFFACIEFDSPIAHWDWQIVTNYAGLFADFGFKPAPFDKGMSFNQDVGSLPIENATNIAGMFSSQRYNNAFNNGGSPSIGLWDVSNTNTGRFIFRRCAFFNQPLNLWDTSNWVSADFMFSGANSFDQPIGDWNITNITNLDNFLSINSEFSHLDDIYQKWSLLNVQPNVPAHFGNNNFTSAGQEGKDILENIHNWNIIDQGLI